MKSVNYIAFTADIDDVICRIKNNIPDIMEFPEVKKLSKHFQDIADADNELNSSIQKSLSIVKELRNMICKTEVVNLVDEEDDDVQIVSVSKCDNVKSKCDNAQISSKRKPESKAVTSQALKLLQSKTDPYFMVSKCLLITKHNWEQSKKVYGRKSTNIWHPGTVENYDTSNLYFRVMFDDKSTKLCPGSEVALSDTCPQMIRVGSRVCGLYKDDNSDLEFYFGAIVLETAYHRNYHRCLLLFENGVFSYCGLENIYKVVSQNVDVSKDVPQTVANFVKEYLELYPNRVMLTMKEGQDFMIESNGAWSWGRVTAIDCCLAKIFFHSRKKCEWIYRGSDRFAIFRSHKATSLANFCAKKPSAVPAPGAVSHTPAAHVNDKSVTGNKSEVTQASPPKQTSGDMLATEQTLANVPMEYDNDGCHICNSNCLKNLDSKTVYKGENPFIIPIKCGWTRQIAKACSISSSNRRHVYYQAPCGRCFRDVAEVDKFLRVTNSSLTIDLFCFNPMLHCHTEFYPSSNNFTIGDISHGKENIPLSCVNVVDNTLPDPISYSTTRKPTLGVYLNTDSAFLCGCSCTDNCRDPMKCECQQLTNQVYIAANGGKDKKYGYSFRRLKEQLTTGIYECNVNCHCDNRCLNRVVQNGLERKLQVYRTEKRGWGLRCLNDIPAGAFICFYVGELLTSNAANEKGQAKGDEYLAELDYIDVIERMKEDYESDVSSLEDDEKQDSEEKSKSSCNSKDDESYESHDGSDSTFSGEKYLKSQVATERPVLRKRKKEEKNEDESQSSSLANSKIGKKVVDSTPPDTSLPTSDSNKMESTASWILDSNSTDENFDSGANNKGTGKYFVSPKAKTFPQDTKNSSRQYRSLRSYMNDTNELYVIDAKSFGNLGRYLNHSCNPNTFVQNVFIDTHDQRFPWVSFFTSKFVRAGNELTWDYNYTVGSVPGKVLYCFCGSSQCRGRLL